MCSTCIVDISEPNWFYRDSFFERSTISSSFPSKSPSIVMNIAKSLNIPSYFSSERVTIDVISLKMKLKAEIVSRSCANSVMFVYEYKNWIYTM